tara:strand:- start:746 stop:1465 length:720 start_codon:yes stop_codon:yes gene_type:complete
MKKPKKSLSQNFIIDKNICKKIVNIINIKNKEILEIGAGYGFLTDVILEKKPKKIIIIEKDKYLSNILKNKYKDNKILTVIENDILKCNLDGFKNLIIISNLPYNVSTKIILHLFKYNKNIKEMLLMIQKEVSLKFDYNLDKMNKYKFLTKTVSNFERCFDVSPNVFKPKPKVTSSIVRFKFNNKNIDLEKAYKFSNAIFKNVRKKISNNIDTNNTNKLLDKRVNEISIKELLYIYNSF